MSVSKAKLRPPLGVRKCMLLIAALVLTGCALLERPRPATRLQLQLPRSAWLESPSKPNDRRGDNPSDWVITAVQSHGWLRTEQLLVLDGARLMQYPDLRWVATPERMLNEQLEIAYSIKNGAGKSRIDLPRIELMLSDFSIHVDADGHRTIVVAAIGSVSCKSTVTTLPVQTATRPTSAGDAQSIAEDFAQSSAQMIHAILQAAQLSQFCL
jgi:hypothetical protein